MIKWHPHDFVTGSAVPVPGTVKCRKDVSFEFGRELIPIVKTKVQRSRMRLDQYVRDDRFAGQLRMSPFVARIGMISNVEPWPTVKAAGLYAADVVRRQIIPQIIPLVSAHPEFT